MTPHDWAQLSEWLDETLPADARAQLEARFAVEPELARAAARLKTLHATAGTLGPTPADVTAWRTRAKGHALGPLLVLLLAGLTGLTAWQLRGAQLDGAQLDGAQLEVVGTVPTDALGAPTRAADEGSARPDAGRAVNSPAVAVEVPLLPVVPPSVPDGGPMRSSSRPDASTSLALATALVALAADAGTPTELHLNPGESYVVPVAWTSVTLTPAGVVSLRPIGADATMVVTKAPGTVQLVSHLADGGVAREYQIRVEAQRDLAFSVFLEVGAKRKVWAPARQRWSVGSNAVASVIEADDRLEVTGAAAGETTLEVWFDDGAHLTWPIHVDPKPSGDELQLISGNQKVLSLEEGTKAHVEDPTVVKVRPLGKQVMLIGTKAGSTMLVITRAEEVVSRRRVIVSRPTADEPPPVSTTHQVSLSDAGPFHVRVGASLALVVSDLERVSSPSAFVGMRFKEGAVLVWGSTPGTAVVTLQRRSGAEQRVTVVIDP